MTTYKSLAVSIERMRPLDSPRHSLSFTPDEWARLAGLYGVITVLHVCGWGLFLYYSSR